MSFSVAQYQEVITRTNSELNELPPIANAAIQRIESRYSWIPFVGGWIKDALNKFVSLMEEFLAKVESYLRSSAVPVMMWEAGNTWENIQRGAGTMAGDIKGQLQASSVQWSGIAGGAYQSGVANQVGAVQEISGLAAATSGAATAIAISGLGFYVAILAALVSLAFAIATAASGVGLAAGIVAAAIAVGAAAGLFYLGVESHQRTLQGLVAGNSAFPAGKWPLATTSS
jgi:hypothetical protein